MTAAANIVVGNPVVESNVAGDIITGSHVVKEKPSGEDNPNMDFHGPMPESVKKTSPAEAAEEPSRKGGCSCSVKRTVAVLAVSLLLAAAAVSALFILTSTADGGPEVMSISVSGSLSLRAADHSMFKGDDRFDTAVASALASTLAAQTNAVVTVDDVQVTSNTRRLETTEALRGHQRRLEDSFVVGYMVLLTGKEAPKPELAIDVLRAADVQAMTTKINMELKSQGVEQDAGLQVVSISAEYASSGFEGGDHGGLSGDSGHGDRGDHSGGHEGHSGEHSHDEDRNGGGE